MPTASLSFRCTLQLTATHCNIATHCNTLQHTATHCNTLQRTSPRCTPLQHLALLILLVSRSPCYSYYLHSSYFGAGWSRLPRYLYYLHYWRFSNCLYAARVREQAIVSQITHTTFTTHVTRITCLIHDTCIPQITCITPITCITHVTRMTQITYTPPMSIQLLVKNGVARHLTYTAGWGRSPCTLLAQTIACGVSFFHSHFFFGCRMGSLAIAFLVQDRFAQHFSHTTCTDYCM